MPGMLAWQLFETLQDTYDLEDDTVHSLVLSYHTYTSAITKTIKVVRLDKNSLDVINSINIRTKKGGSLRKINLDDLTLHVRVKRGSTTESDVNCDTTFMFETIEEIGTSIRSK